MKKKPSILYDEALLFDNRPKRGLAYVKAFEIRRKILTKEPKNILNVINIMIALGFLKRKN